MPRPRRVRRLACSPLETMTPERFVSDSPCRRRLLGIVLYGASVARAQPAVDRAIPVTLIVPTAAGSSSDRLARIIAQALSEILATPVHVQNIPGNTGSPAPTPSPPPRTTGR